MNNIISEIELTYKPNFGEGSRVKIRNSQDAYKVIIASWNMNTIELQEEFKVLLLNSSAWHNIHHSDTNTHFGEVSFIWDRICGTTREKMEEKKAAKKKVKLAGQKVQV